MQVIAVTTCSDRKRFPVSSRLNAASLPQGNQSAVVRIWQERLRSVAPVATAAEVYGGRSFQEALAASHASGTNLRIISGGLGLIRGTDQISAYSLSLVQKSADFVGARVTEGVFDVARWWKEVQRHACSAPLARLVRRNPDAIIVLGLSKAYLSLVESDLGALSDDELHRIRIVGLGIEQTCPERLRATVLPYDNRLDGPDSPSPGTRGDFASRAMRHFIEAVFPESRHGDPTAHKAAVLRVVGDWRVPRTISRQAKTDDEIIGLIKKNWEAIRGQSSRGLRYLRDVEQVACEQARYADLFRRATREVMQ